MMMMMMMMLLLRPPTPPARHRSIERLHQLINPPLYPSGSIASSSIDVDRLLVSEASAEPRRLLRRTMLLLLRKHALHTHIDTVRSMERHHSLAQTYLFSHNDQRTCARARTHTKVPKGEGARV
jgi:hypothetical protein